MKSAAFDAFTYENAISGQINKVYVRVRNRGPKPAASVNVKLHWAFAGTALPDLPADFWNVFPGDSADTSKWHPLGVNVISNLVYSGSSVAGYPGRPSPSCDFDLNGDGDTTDPGETASDPAQITTFDTDLELKAPVGWTVTLDQIGFNTSFTLRPKQEVLITMTVSIPQINGVGEVTVTQRQLAPNVKVMGGMTYQFQPAGSSPDFSLGGGDPDSIVVNSFTAERKFLKRRFPWFQSRWPGWRGIAQPLPSIEK